MNVKLSRLIICLYLLCYLDVATAANSFLETILRFTGISITPNQTRGNNNFNEGEIWLVQLGQSQVSESRKITHSKSYRTPLWIPGHHLLVAMKGKQLVQMDEQGNQEKALHTLTYDTALIGFDKNDPNRVLVLRDSVVGILSLKNWQITPVSYDENNPKDRAGLDKLTNNSREYASAKLFVESKKEPKSQGGFNTFNTIRIETNGGKNFAITCPWTCGQATLSENAQQLLYIAPIEED